MSFCIAAETEQKIDFSRQVQPILSAKCAKCHGPGKTSGGIAFDTRERALAATESGAAAIVEGHAEKSEMIARVTATDETLRMPPEGKPLTAAEVTILKQWISEGAKWSQHWAYRKLEKPTVPKVTESQLVKNPIDNFIFHGLEHKQLKPNALTDKRTLVRRAYYNLTGLPPTQAEIAAFEQDNTPNAWEKLIDKLLASEHYGEHWGRKWLDVVRYAETNSFERDNPKPHVWRYRDYVIRSFNNNKPYDQFLKEQLAGDELSKPTAEQYIATGFYRLGVWDDEPADRELAMYDGFDDIITTVGQGMLGLTFNCARCHDHKIDPISQVDYYQLVSFVRHMVPMAGSGPGIEHALFNSEKDRVAFEEAKRDREQQMQVAQKELDRLEDIFRIVTSKETESKKHVGKDFEALTYQLYLQSFDLLPDFTKLKPSKTEQAVDNLIDIAVAKRNTEFGLVFQGKLKIPADGDYTFFLDSDDGSRLILDEKTLLTYDGIHGTGSEKQLKVTLNAGTVNLKLEYFQRHNGLGLSLAWNGPDFARRSLSQGSEEDIRPMKKGNIRNIILKRGKEVLGDDEFAKYQTALQQLEKLKVEPNIEKALVIKEQGTHAPAQVFLLQRGTPGAHGVPVEPAFPSLFAAAKPQIAVNQLANSSGRRTALANWISSAENPLTARVFVNRVWQGQFGRGIVRSPNNFGGLGTPPTHPELLDWLAQEFVQSGWNVKKLQKLIMMSYAYQMSSAGNASALTKDPANDLFWRYDLRRLSAEEVRDSIMAVNRTLNLEMYGNSVYPEIQAEVLAGQSRPGAGWKTSSPRDAARRSIYIHVKRSLISPLLASFDFPETDTSCEARFTTTQPAQAFAMLNGKFANEQAHWLAEYIQKMPDTTTPEKFVAAAYPLVLERTASTSEIASGVTLINALQQQHGLTAAQSQGQFCLFMYNLNEFMYLD
jgi:Protein of unknown function (DUF1553)/Protein of unknown function (DUF1549)/Planctomycete cytochrome C/PA14 domain